MAMCLGAATGLRTFAAPASICWGARLGWIDLAASRVAFLTHSGVVAIVSLFAAGELVADKLPFIGDRTGLFPLTGRIVLGAFSGGVLCASTGHSAAAGAVAGILGAIAGAFGGFHARRSLSRKAPGWVVALVEDVIAIGGALLIVSQAQGL